MKTSVVMKISISAQGLPRCRMQSTSLEITYVCVLNPARCKRNRSTKDGHDVFFNDVHTPPWLGEMRRNAQRDLAPAQYQAPDF